MGIPPLVTPNRKGRTKRSTRETSEGGPNGMLCNGQGPISRDLAIIPMVLPLFSLESSVSPMTDALKDDSRGTAFHTLHLCWEWLAP